jgi:hypothetical protein
MRHDAPRRRRGDKEEAAHMLEDNGARVDGVEP